jgi:hypothetical protein
MARKPKKRIYHIILTNHGKQLKYLYFTHSEERANKKLASLIKENKKVAFPMRWNNHEHVMKECEYELVIIKYKDENDNDVSKIKDNTGKYVNYKSSDENWIVCNRAPYDIEETFWVYGYHPRLQRKDFNWIFDNFIKKDANDKYAFKSVQAFRNKLLVDMNGKLEIVICKNRSDCARLYNKIESVSRDMKLKYIAFMGDVTDSKYKENWVDRIQQLSHWKKFKINRNSTRP